MGVLLDSSVVIAAERAGESPADLIERVVASVGDQAVALSSIGYTELVHGQYRATDERKRLATRVFLESLIVRLPVHSYTVETARIAGHIDAQQRMIGVSIPFADLLIGATALALGFSILTVNVRHFRLIPGLTVIPF